MSSVKKILIAEDELLIAKVLKMVLEKKHFEVMQVSDEVGAIKLSGEFCPDLIIMDIHLKNKTSGISAGKQIRQNGIKCPIIFTTGNSFEQTREEIKSIENSHLFIKPVDSEQLLKYIELNF